jgi:hypothetical protein
MGILVGVCLHPSLHGYPGSMPDRLGVPHEEEGQCGGAKGDRDSYVLLQ